MEIEIKLNGTSAEEVKETLVHNFGNSIGFRESNGKTLTVTSIQESVIKDLMIIAGLTITGESGM